MQAVIAGYAAWAGRHATLFGLAWDSDLATVNAWEPAFAASGFTAAELDSASAWLAGHAGALKHLDQHRAALLERVRSRRAVDRDAPAEDRGRCAVCDGPGLVVVPHPAGVRGGRWLGVRVGPAAFFYTCGVSCTCVRGRSLNCTNRQDERVLELKDYEQKNPDWRQQLARRQREARAEDEAVAGGEYRGYDPLTEVMDRLLARQRQPGDDREEDAA